MMPAQNLSNHARYVPGFHFVTGAFTIGALVWAVKRYLAARSPDAGLLVVMALALVGQFWYLRAFPLAVQDRLIRLEERLRMQRLMPQDADALSQALSGSQLVALRFASDAEFPALARKVADEKIESRAAIKKLVTDWRADHMRA